MARELVGLLLPLQGKYRQQTQQGGDGPFQSHNWFFVLILHNAKINTFPEKTSGWGWGSPGPHVKEASPPPFFSCGQKFGGFPGGCRRMCPNIANFMPREGAPLPSQERGFAWMKNEKIQTL